MRARRRAARSVAALLACATVGLLLAAAAPAAAQYGSWNYSKDIDVLSGAYARTDAPVELPVNFTNWLPGGKSLDLNSIRVVEYTSAGRTVLVGETPSQFDQGVGFNATTNASGELVWLLEGSTAAATTRYYRVYFDSTDAPKAAPSYTAGLSWNAGSGVVTTPGYIATFSATKAGLSKLENKLSGSPKIMWSSVESGYPNMGNWHTILEEGNGWMDSWNGADAAARSVQAGPVRVTVSNQRDGGAVTWTETRKFYAGSPAAPFFDVAVRIDKNTGAGGTGTVWLKRTVWSKEGTPTVRTIVPPDNFQGTTTHDIVFDYGADGGVGITSSSRYAPNSSEDFEVDSVLRQAQFDTWGASWKMEGFPIEWSYPMVVHNQTSEPGAAADMTSVWERYNSPVIPAIAGTATVAGTITDAATAEPVLGAVVRVRSGSFSATVRSSASGSFVIIGVPIGSATYSVRADHYTYFSSSPALAAGNNTINTALNAAPSIDLRSASLGGSVNWLLGMDTLNGGPVVPPNDDFSAPGASESGFSPMDVPGDWDLLQGATNNNIYGWYRTHVNVPGSWSGNVLRFRDFRVDDVDAAYFNGTLIGQSGAFPPSATPRNASPDLAYDEGRDYWIAPGSVNFGADNVIAMRVFDQTGAGGITPGEPILEVAPPTATVSGTVSGPGGPLANATVAIEGIGTATTAANGTYSFSYVPGDVYDVTATGFGHKPVSLSLDVPDSGVKTLDIVLESSGSIAGKVTRNGAPLEMCRVYASGPNVVSTLTDANGDYALSTLPGSYAVTFNAYRTTPQEHNVNVDGPETLNVDLDYGVAPVYDAFAGTALDGARWDFFNPVPVDPPAGDSVATVSNGVLELQVAPNRGGIISTASFPPVATHEITIPRPYVGVNGLMNLYGGAGGFDQFVEMGHEGYFLGTPRVVVYGTGNNYASASWVGYPFSLAVVRTHNYYDFYVDNHYWHSDTSSGLTDQNSRVFLYGFEPADGETISYFSTVVAGVPAAPVAKSLGDSRNDDAGSAVAISGAVVTASFGESFFIEDADRASGIRVMAFGGLPFDNPPRPNPEVGDIVNVIGRIVHQDKEARLQSLDFTAVGSNQFLDPVVLTNKAAAIMDEDGATPQGLLVTVFGKVTGVDRDDQFNPTGIFIDDGSGLPGDGTTPGLYIPVPAAWVLQGFLGPFGGEYLMATGVMTVSTHAGDPIPALRAQSSSDVSWF